MKLQSLKRKTYLILFQLLLIQLIYGQNILKVTSQNLNLRQFPNTTSKIISTIPQGTTIDIKEDCDCEWIPIEYNGLIGYVSSKYLLTEEEYRESLTGNGFYVATSSLNVRISPSTSSFILGNFKSGQIIIVNQIIGNWAEVNVFSKSNTKIRTAYIHTKYLKQATLKQIEQFEKKQKSTSYTNSSNRKYYTNTYGEKVESPSYYDSRPAGATALCRDGTYSFSRNRRGTCSHHGGVAKWLN